MIFQLSILEYRKRKSVSSENDTKSTNLEISDSNVPPPSSTSPALSGSVLISEQTSKKDKDSCPDSKKSLDSPIDSPDLPLSPTEIKTSSLTSE